MRVVPRGTASVWPASSLCGSAGRTRLAQACGGRMYRQVPAQVDLPALEREVLEFWADAKVFERTLDRNAGGPAWVFYEGPPTANGRPGVHHVEARVFKDIFPRFKTMNGYD